MLRSTKKACLLDSLDAETGRVNGDQPVKPPHFIMKRREKHDLPRIRLLTSDRLNSSPNFPH